MSDLAAHQPNSSWKTRQLGEILTLINGRAYNKDEEKDSGTPVLRIQNLNGGNRWFYSDLQLPENKYCDEGDLLFAWSATFGPYIWWGSKVIYHYHIWKIECGPELDKKFAYYLLQHITDKVKSAGRGISMLHMTKSGMEAWSVQIPPLEEQKRIAAILDQADTLRRQRQRALSRLNQLGQSIFYEMFGDVRKNSKAWPLHCFGELAANEDGKRVPIKLSDRSDIQGEYPYYGASGIIDYVNDYIFEGERLLVGEDGANLLSRSSPIAFIAHGKYWVNNHAHVLAYNGRASLRYLEYFLEAIDLAPYVSGSAQPKITQKQLNSIQVPCPPLKLQDQFAKRITQISEQRALLAKDQKSFEHLFSSLQHRAFRGELGSGQKSGIKGEAA
jgi:type I restriction enzyme S subunit